MIVDQIPVTQYLVRQLLSVLSFKTPFLICAFSLMKCCSLPKVACMIHQHMTCMHV